MNHYTIAASNNTGFLAITCVFDTKETDLLLHLPAWRPGRYMAQNYASRIRNIRFHTGDNSEPVVEKTAPHTWRVERPAGIVTVSYEYTCDLPDAGNCCITEGLIYINPINCLLYCTPEEACTLTLTYPAGYSYSGMLPATVISQETENQLILTAASFFELADSPFAVSTLLTEYEYEVQKVPFKISFIGKAHPQQDLTARFQKFTETQFRLFGEFPFHRYNFLILMLPHKYYHGVEHAAGTVIVLGPDTEADAPEMLDNLFGVSCHELFHAWNALAMRPAQIMPYDYSKVPLLDTGYVIEGFTTYYGDLLLSRSGAMSADFYLKELDICIRKHYENYGRYALSLIDSSLDLAVDGYVAGVPGRKVSIYNEGALVAFILDVRLRMLSQNKFSLDGLMQNMWKEFGKKTTGYTHADCIRLAGDAGPLLHRLVTVPGAIEQELPAALEYVGLELAVKVSEDELYADYGFKVTEKNGMPTVAVVVPGSPAAALLAPGDVVLNIERREASISVTCQTLFGTAEGVLRPVDTKYSDTYELRKMENPTPEQLNNFNLWLEGDL